jgi:hypothetical protein
MAARGPAQTAAPDAALVARASSGEAAAQLELGRAYASGKGAPQSAAEAVLWLRKAAEQKNAEAARALGEFYRDGLGKQLPRDPKQAVGWFRQAAELGDLESAGMLGVLYSYGQGVGQDYAEAYFWLDVAAASAGPKQAQYIANRQRIGEHITADELEAVEARVAQWRAAHPR